jgi:tRNA pseudouridine55 synthase
MTGFLLVDKAKGPTSHDVVQAVRSLTGVRRAGHTGTLDPFATGLLPVCLGRATRLARFVSGAVKTYLATVRFGFATHTYDATGRRVGPHREVRLEPETLAPVLASFVGKQQQVPPLFAAKKVKGQRMYRLARAGVKVEPKPVTVVIRRITLLDVQDDRATLDVEVESGTYIRSLAHDLGARLGCGAHLEALRRTRVGPLSVDRALSVGELESLRVAGHLEDAVLQPSEVLSELPAVELTRRGAERIVHGMRISGEDIRGRISELPVEQPIRLSGPDGALVAVGTVAEKAIHSLVVLQTPKEGNEAVIVSDFTG